MSAMKDLDGARDAMKVLDRHIGELETLAWNPQIDWSRFGPPIADQATVFSERLAKLARNVSTH